MNKKPGLFDMSDVLNIIRLKKNIMLKADKAKKIISILNKIYPETPIPLNHKNNFELLISVLLSAQCTDKRSMK